MQGVFLHIRIVLLQDKIRRSVVFFLFFVVVYLETVCPSFLASVHSSVITILFSFPFAMVTPIGYELYKS